MLTNDLLGRRSSGWGSDEVGDVNPAPSGILSIKQVIVVLYYIIGWLNLCCRVYVLNVQFCYDGN